MGVLFCLIFKMVYKIKVCEPADSHTFIFVQLRLSI